MTIRLYPTADWTTNQLLAAILRAAMGGARVRFLVDAGSAPAVVQRLRVALSRSRNRNRLHKRKIAEFTLKHDVYPHTENGVRHECIVMWIVREPHHKNRELLDDLMERES